MQSLGTRSPLPVEVAQFGHESHVVFLSGLGAQPTLRRTAGGEVFVTDNGNYIYDCRFDGIANPLRLEDALLHRAGVVDSGLFLGLATCALIADDTGVQELRR